MMLSASVLMLCVPIVDDLFKAHCAGTEPIEFTEACTLIETVENPDQVFF